MLILRVFLLGIEGALPDGKSGFFSALSASSPSNTKEFDMADPKDLQEAADAIHEVRGLAAVQRHKELDDPLRQAEDWARNEYRKVRERNGDPDASDTGNSPHR